ncbi:aldo/keto reductase [Phenylobacterium immobile]|uniref:aldo/keto reductase n=1 Tax=Phenylobacterium immobile TaxID=21 RepID=UPI000A534CF4|nr:aldo/keto reductase [Phenylobacterium immobile]
MLYRTLGRTGFTVSEIGFGCASYWGKPRFSERRAIGLVHQALDLGVTVFDTGASYSAGEAEPRLGRALKGRDASSLVISTKAGTFHAGRGRIGRDFTPAGVVRSAEASLANLGLDALPVLQLHGPARSDLTAELLAALAGLKARGLVRSLGLNSFDPVVLEHAIGLGVFDVMMVDYNVLRPERAPLIARAVKAGLGVLAGMPLAMGHTGLKVARIGDLQDVWYAARGLVRHRREVKAGVAFSFLHRRSDITGSQAALAYVLGDPNVASAVIGTTRPAHLAENVQASGVALPADLHAQIVRTQAAVA